MSLSIFVSDLHASLKLPYADVTPDATCSDRLEDVLAVIEEIRQYAETHDVRRVFILGDLFNDRHPDAPTLVRVARALKELIGEQVRPGSTIPTDLIPCREVWLLPGNHDAHDRAGRVYSLGLFAELKVDGLFVATTPTTVTYGVDGGGDDIEFVLMPWLPEKRFNDKLSEINEGLLKRRRPRILLIHQNVPGAVDGAYTAKKGADVELFKPWDLVLSGHIHKPQTFDNGRYLGSPLHLRFTDADDHSDRGFWVLDHGAFTRLCDSECLEDDPPALQFIKTRAPRFVRWRFIEDDDMEPHTLALALLPELLDELDDDGVPVYLEVIIEGGRESVDKTRLMVKQALDLGELEVDIRHIKLSSVITDDGASDRVRAAVSEPGKLSLPIELCKAFVSASEPVLPDGITADDLLTFASEVIA